MMLVVYMILRISSLKLKKGLYIPVAFQIIDGIWIFFPHLSFNISNSANASSSIGVLYTALKSDANFLIFLYDIYLNELRSMCMIHRCTWALGYTEFITFLKAREPVDTEKQHIHDTSVLKAIKHFKPEFGGFIGTNCYCI
jgi:hypothetical protein